MSKLEELIQELCPDGVEYKPLGDICIVSGRIGFRGYTKQDQVEKGEGALSLSPSNIGENGIDFSNSTYINWDKYNESPEIMVSNGDIIFTKTASVGKTEYVDNLPCKATINPQLVLIKEIKCNSKYLSYVLKTKEFQKKVMKIKGQGTIPTISQKEFIKLTVPVPPLEVQKEIVRLLDEFTAKTAELQAELNKEYEARKKQYEYYRDSLFSDKLNDLSLELCPNGVQYCELKEIADISTGSHNTNEGVENGMYPFYVRSQEPLTLNSYDYDETAIITAGDGVGVGKVFHFVNGKYALHQRAYRIHANTTKVEDKFLYYYFCTNFMKYIEKTMFKGSVPSIRRPMLNAFKIPVPPLEIQQKIVRLLDDFTAKTTKLQDNLNEELEACKKQYEFYRDKLLTFKELNESEVN